MKTVSTKSGQRRIDTTRKLIETAKGDMVPYIRITPREGYFAYMVNDTSGVLVTAEGHREAHSLTAEQIAANQKAEAIRTVMSEGYGDY